MYCDVCSQEKAREATFYSYTKHINGFAANLDDEVAAAIASKTLPLHLADQGGEVDLT